MKTAIIPSQMPYCRVGLKVYCLLLIATAGATPGRRNQYIYPFRRLNPQCVCIGVTSSPSAGKYYSCGNDINAFSVVAGIEESTIRQAKTLNFTGVAALGSVWSSSSAPDAVSRLLNACAQSKAC